MVRPRVVVAGADSAGALCAAVMAGRGPGSGCLYDIIPGLARGKAMDIHQASACQPPPPHAPDIVAADGIGEADFVVIQAGYARQAGLSRLDLLQKDLEVMRALGEQSLSSCPQAQVLRILEIDLDTGEQAALDGCVPSLRDTVQNPALA